MASTMLLLNDCARLVFAFQPSFLISNDYHQAQGEESDPFSLYSIIEEESKVKEINTYNPFRLTAESGLETSVAHLIEDEEVRHLAHLDIFSPPPDLA